MQLILALLFAITLAPAAAYPSSPDPDEIVRHADEARGPLEPFSMDVRVHDVHGSDTKDSVYRVYSKGVEFSLVEQTEPARLQGRKLLMRDRDLWLFTPNISRPTRVSFEQRLTGEVANGDLMRTNFAQDYSATLIAAEKGAYKLRLQARTKEVTYRRIDYWVDMKTFYPIKAEFYAISGKLLKTAQYLKFGPVLGRRRMIRILIADAVQSGRTSLIDYSKQKRENLDDTFFSKESLAN